MLDIRLFREEPEIVRAGLTARGDDESMVDRVLEIDAERRTVLAEVESLKARRNEISKEIPKRAKAGEPIDALKDESKMIGEKIAMLDAKARGVDEALRDLLLRIPNVPDASVPIGPEETANRVVRSWGEPVRHNFPAKPHWELGEALGILDLPRGAKVTGSGFYALKGAGARLERALIGWMLDTHVARNGYTEVNVPFLVNRRTMTGTGQLPKFEEDLYHIDGFDLHLIPTAEVPVTNLHADEILEPEALPIAYCCHTPCFRSEAGSAGRENRGISRVHQFHKVELVHITRPEESDGRHEDLIGHACGLLEALEVPYRVVEISTEGIGFCGRKQIDLEIWAPGMEAWLEASSCSNFGSFQARRANIRYRPAVGAKPEFCHTLNGSGLALPRLLITLLENDQRADGTVAVPAVVRDRMGCDVIGG